MNEEAFYHYVLMDMNTLCKEFSVEQILHDFKKYYPSSFEALKNAFIEQSLSIVQE